MFVCLLFQQTKLIDQFLTVACCSDIYLLTTQHVSHVTQWTASQASYDTNQIKSMIEQLNCGLLLSRIIDSDGLTPQEIY